jgi:hypothetical protein
MRSMTSQQILTSIDKHITKTAFVELRTIDDFATRLFGFSALPNLPLQLTRSLKPGGYSRCAGGAAGGLAGGVAGGGSSLRHAPWLLFITVNVVPPQQYTVHLSGAL